VGCQRHAPTLYPRERTGTHSIGGWAGPQGRSGRVRKFLPPPRFDPGHPARSESLYRLYHPGPHICICIHMYIRLRRWPVTRRQKHICTGGGRPRWPKVVPSTRSTERILGDVLEQPGTNTRKILACQRVFCASSMFNYCIVTASTPERQCC